jgi:predicted nucleotidyltransferase
MHTFDWVRPNTILLGENGSGAHGTATALSDTDQIGVCIEPPEFLIGLGRFEQSVFRDQFENDPSQPGDTEGVVYSLRKWARLSAEGSPNILSAVFLPRYEILTAAGQQLIDNRDLFLSKLSASRFSGYLSSQKCALLGLKTAKKQRPAVTAQFGFDVKFAYHMLRVGIQGAHLLGQGSYPIPLVGDDLTLLRAVRAGKVPLADCISLAEKYETELESLKTSSALPEEPNRAAIDALLIDIYQTHWAA